MFALLDWWDYGIIALIVIIFAGGRAVVSSLRPVDMSRLIRLERKLDLILRHLNIEIPDPMMFAGLSTKVRELADQNRKIEAIKVHMDETGLGLKDAKEVVEAYMNRQQ